MTNFNINLEPHIKNLENYRKLFDITNATRRAIRQAYFKAGKKTIEDINTDILRTPRHGRRYIINGKVHIASVAGEAPANLSGDLRKSLDFNVINYHKLLIGYDDTVDYGKWLEKGTTRMKPRPGLRIGISKNRKDGTYEKMFLEELRKAFFDPHYLG